MDFNKISPYIRIAMDSIIKPPWRLVERIIYDYELLYVKGGKILVTVENKSYYGSAGDVFLFKPMQSHSITIIGDLPFHQPHLHFDLCYREDSCDLNLPFKPSNLSSRNSFNREANLEDGLPLPNHIHIQNPLAFENMLFDIIREHESKAPFYRTHIKGMFIQMLTHLLREDYWKNHQIILSNMTLLTQIKDYLDQHINRDVYLDELVEHSHLSKYYLLRLFKNAFKISPIRYHQLTRIKKAKEMVQFSGLTLTQIAQEFGYNSIHSFSRAFKAIEGVPPSFYRKSI